MSRLAQRPERNNVTIIIGAQVEVHKFFEYDDAQAFYECMLVHLVETCAEYWIDFDGYYRDVRDGAVHRSGRIGEVAA